MGILRFMTLAGLKSLGMAVQSPVLDVMDTVVRKLTTAVMEVGRNSRITLRELHTCFRAYYRNAAVSIGDLRKVVVIPESS